MDKASPRSPLVLAAWVWGIATIAVLAVGPLLATPRTSPVASTRIPGASHGHTTAPPGRSPAARRPAGPR